MFLCSFGVIVYLGVQKREIAQEAWNPQRVEYVYQNPWRMFDYTISSNEKDSADYHVN